MSQALGCAGGMRVNKTRFLPLRGLQPSRGDACQGLLIGANPLSLYFLYNFIYFWLCWVFVDVQAFPLVAASGGYSLIVVHGLLIAMASVFAEHGF